METLFTPWRRAYVSVKQAAGGCLFCDALRAVDEPGSLVVHLAAHHLVMLNRYPYTSGHLMIAPRRHLARPGDAGADVRAEFWPLVIRAHEVLERAYAPDGFNLGMNLGRAAGAGVPDHYHFHLVPRWQGDTNFMSVVGEVRLIPEEPAIARERLRALFAGEEP